MTTVFAGWWLGAVIIDWPLCCIPTAVGGRVKEGLEFMEFIEFMEFMYGKELVDGDMPLRPGDDVMEGSERGGCRVIGGGGGNDT